uniref:ZP domain-containing protein n=1 Tax=Acrobeloides nanus TaxID=290746 RepID=A0A914EEH2_9BILA
MKFSFYGFLVYSIAIFAINAQQAINNSIIASPKVSCGNNQITIIIETERPFGGNVYSQGFFNKDLCRVTGDGVGNSVNITIPINADCGMRRRRILNPRGIVLETTVMVMFHKLLLTKNDKSFHVECKYMENNVMITQQLDVSSLPTTDLKQDMSEDAQKALPKCSYEVLYDNENGQIVQFATIGQPIYHKWTCEDSKDNMIHCLTVHSCKVDDGRGNIQELLDTDGCPIDRVLLDELEYKTDLQAGKRSYVFKFADQATVYFSCQLRLEVKTTPQGVCERSSDHCSNYEAGSQRDATNLVQHDVYITNAIESDFPKPDTTDFDLDIAETTMSNSISDVIDLSNLSNWPNLDSFNLKDEAIRRAPSPLFLNKTIKRIYTRDSSTTPEEPIRQQSIDMDVTAGSVNVIEISASQVTSSKSEFEAIPRIVHNFMAEREKICIARNAIYIAIFIISFVLLVFITAFCYILLKLTKPEIEVKGKRRIEDSILAFDI